MTDNDKKNNPSRKLMIITIIYKEYKVTFDFFQKSVTAVSL